MAPRKPLQKVTNCVLQTVQPVISHRLSLRVTKKSQALLFSQFLVYQFIPPRAPGTIRWRDLFSTTRKITQMYPIAREVGSVEAGQLWSQLWVEIEALGAVPVTSDLQAHCIDLQVGGETCLRGKIVVQWAVYWPSKTIIELYTGFLCLWMQLIDSFLLAMYNMYIYVHISIALKKS